MLHELGEVALARRQYRLAIDHLERALADSRDQDIAKERRAGILFALARALWASGADRPRALQLATEARDLIMGLTDSSGHDLSRITRWLGQRRR